MKAEDPRMLQEGQHHPRQVRAGSKCHKPIRLNLRSDSNNDSRELSRIAITDHQKSNDNKALVQATSGNVMLLGPLGNLRQSGNGDFAGNNSPNATVKTVDHRHKNLQEAALSSRPRNCYSKLGSNSVMGNIVRQPGGEFRQGLGLITSMDPESGTNTDSMEVARAQALQKHLNRCTEARKLKEWNRLLSETEFSISSGADSVPQVYAMQAEALLRLHRHQEASTAYQKGPVFSADFYTKLFGLTIASYILMIGAQVYMAAGRFEEALATAEQAARLDPSNGEVSDAPAGPSLVKFEKAVEDCTAALAVQPYHSKARLRRAHCNAELGRWESSIQDFEMLIRESPADEEVGRALFDAQVQLKEATW
ncbi:hypothetical protein OIU78_012218 [Salix suchowensis]|nr:hypothetical protein OIU78_012218 [Salix suchowensis]KAJ6335544.1 hypothetical protein OIU78_012218 [Salix suchowensis]